MYDLSHKFRFAERHYASVTSQYYLLNFLTQYLAMKERETKPFHYHLLCMDDSIYSVMEALNLDGITLIRCEDFETDELRAVKQDRNLAEYCWTVKPPFLLSLLKDNPSIEGITYLDADLFPFTSLDNVWGQLKECSVVLYPHNFSPTLQHLEAMAGRYNAGMLTFRNDANGLKILQWYVDRVMEWCYNRHEKGKLGDQMYLLHFHALTEGSAECAWWGIDIGPWSLSDRWPYVHDGRTFLLPTTDYPKLYQRLKTLFISLKARLRIASNKRLLDEAGTPQKLTDAFQNWVESGLWDKKMNRTSLSDDYEVQLFHFHQYRFHSDLSYVPASPGYPVRQSLIRHLYEPYTRRVIQAYELVKSRVPDYTIPTL